jgi:hypothetical protein
VQARRFRTRFEPDTLEMEEPGTLSVDAQLGGSYGDGEYGSRLIVPDYELDLALSKRLELDVQGGYALVELGGQKQEIVGDATWVALRWAPVQLEDKQSGRTFGVGLQLGPRFPGVHNMKAFGLGALALVGAGNKRLHVVLNLGSALDRDQEWSLAYGADVVYELSVKAKWRALMQVAGAHFFGDDPDQALLSIGIAHELSDDFELSLLVLTGPVVKGDRFGMTFGMTYDARLW